MNVSVRLSVCLYWRNSLTTEPYGSPLQCSFSGVLGRFLAILWKGTTTFPREIQNEYQKIYLKPYLFSFKITVDTYQLRMVHQLENNLKEAWKNFKDEIKSFIFMKQFALKMNILPKNQYYCNILPFGILIYKYKFNINT